MAEQAGLVNAYVCAAGHTTWTRNANEGVTPFIIDCPNCEQLARSQFYRVPQQGQPVTHEWYRPTKRWTRRLPADEREHIELGGLLLRPVEPTAEEADRG